jgi:hypothetical protein
MELLSFQADPYGRQVVLSWATASEFNSAHFIIEHSTDGTGFKVIGSVPAAGTSSTIQQYRIVDGAAVSGLNYYRLNSMDLDGSSTTGPVIHVDMGQLNAGIYPNPTDGLIHIDLPSAEEGEGQYNLLDMSGRILQQGVFSIKSESFHLTLDVGGYSQGSYVLELTDAEGHQLLVQQVLRN